MPTTPQDLSGFLGRIAEGDREAFARLYEVTSAKLRGIVLRIVRQPALADEILQEVYLAVWRHAGRFNPGRASAIAWLAAIARNRALDEMRRVRPVALEEQPELETLSDPAPLASEQVAFASELTRLQSCLAALDPPRGEIVRLAYLDGLSREELGTRFGHPAATIKTWLHRSLKQLRTCLGS